MNKLFQVMIVTAVAALAAAGCGRDERATTGGEATATIARPEPQPGELGTDALTQTVELEDGRSENEGGVLTDNTPGVPTPSTTTADPAATQTQTQNSPPPPSRP